MGILPLHHSSLPPGSQLPVGLEPSDPSIPQGRACPWSQASREPCCAPHPERAFSVLELGPEGGAIGLCHMADVSALSSHNHHKSL